MNTCFFCVVVSKSSSDGSMFPVCLAVRGVEHSSSELLMRWTSEKKVTHFTVPVLWPPVESESLSLKEREIRDRKEIIFC